MHSLWFWVAFNAFVLLLLALDLGVFHRGNQKMSFRQALGWSAFWIGLAAGFAALVWITEGQTKSLQFITGYLVEESLSVDNLFVFLTLFQYFHVPEEYQYGVLFWGVIGALVMRGLFIVAGVALVQRFEWVTLVFGAFLIYTGCRLLWRGRQASSPGRNPILRFARRCLRVTEGWENGRFLVRRENQRYVTPLLLVLIMVEASDVMFAVDSVPAVLAISRDAFIVYTSNVFAILGLRALYFALVGVMEQFRYAEHAIAAILLFVGAKMLASPWLEIATEWSLAAIAGILALTLVASWIVDRWSPVREN